jgi:hypothetical protein
MARATGATVRALTALARHLPQNDRCPFRSRKSATACLVLMLAQHTSDKASVQTANRRGPFLFGNAVTGCGWANRKLARLLLCETDQTRVALQSAGGPFVSLIPATKQEEV